MLQKPWVYSLTHWSPQSTSVLFLIFCKKYIWSWRSITKPGNRWKWVTGRASSELHPTHTRMEKHNTLKQWWWWCWSCVYTPTQDFNIIPIDPVPLTKYFSIQDYKIRYLLKLLHCWITSSKHTVMNLTSFLCLWNNRISFGVRAGLNAANKTPNSSKQTWEWVG